MVTFLLILHSLAGVALLGAITHQGVALLRRAPARGDSFVARYSSVKQQVFTRAVAGLYVAQVALGALIYPRYRLDVRIPFEEMSLGWAIGLFELKEHFAGIGLAMLPFYLTSWRDAQDSTQRTDRIGITLLLAFIVWWDLLVGHVLNNIRGLG